MNAFFFWCDMLYIVCLRTLMKTTMTSKNAPATIIFPVNHNINWDNRATVPASLHSQQLIPRNAESVKNLIVEESGKELEGG